MTTEDTTDSVPAVDRRSFLGSLSFAAGAAGVLGYMPSAVYGQQAAASAAAASPAKPAGKPGPKAPLADVAGKTAYITGASSGIGLGIARQCYQAGMNVILGYIDDSLIGAAMANFADKSRVMAFKHDVIDRPGWERLVVAAEKRFQRVHLLVNNAGVGPFSLVSTSTYKDFDWALTVNMFGVFNGIHTFVPRMKAYGEGAHIVTTCSMSGILPGANAGVYTTSKFATLGMMEALRLELQGTNIGTSVYLPGLVNSKIWLSERYRQEQFRNPVPAGTTPPRLPSPLDPPPPVMATGMDPMESGQCVLEGVRSNDMFIFSHPEFKQGIQERFEAIIASIPTGRSMPDLRLASERVTMRVPMYAAETLRLRANPHGPLVKVKP